MPHTIKIEIKPQVLQWAREEAGYKPEDIAAKLHIPAERYSSWETHGKEIPLGILMNIANYYKRQLATFLLPSPPPKVERPKDFRNLANRNSNLSPDTLLAIRRSHKYLELAREILGVEFWINEYGWQQEVKDFLIGETKVFEGNITEWLRRELKITVGDQQKFKNYDDAFKKWRNSIEEQLGIFVFQFPMPKSELDGFSYLSDGPPYAIVINSESYKARRIFTLFHELAHIFKHQGGICIANLTSKKRDIEYECNNFAGKFLIPDNDVFPIESMKDLDKLAKRFKVSREVYLRRNYERKFIKERDFFSFLKRIKEQPNKRNEKKKSSGPAPPILSRSIRGNKFFKLVLEAAYNNKIDYSTASDALGMGFNYVISNE